MTIRSKWLRSSQNPEQISNTVKGAVLGASGFIILGLQFAGVPFTETDVAELAKSLAFVAGFVWMLWGILMKMVVRFGGGTV